MYSLLYALLSGKNPMPDCKPSSNNYGGFAASICMDFMTADHNAVFPSHIMQGGFFHFQLAGNSRLKPRYQKQLWHLLYINWQVCRLKTSGSTILEHVTTLRNTLSLANTLWHFAEDRQWQSIMASLRLRVTQHYKPHRKMETYWRNTKYNDK